MSRNILDHQRDYEQLMARKRQLEEQAHNQKIPQVEHLATQQSLAMGRHPIGSVPIQQYQQELQVKIYKAKLQKQEVIPSLRCHEMIMDWCRSQFSASRIIASKCYKQAQEFFETGAKKKTVLLGSRKNIELTKEDCAKFWGIEMEFKVKKIFRDCFNIVIDETETFHHSQDKTVVARPDGFIKSGLTLSYKPKNLETNFELKGENVEQWLVYEGKAPISGQVPRNIKRDYYLQCCLEMACTGCSATMYSVWTPGCLCVWIIYWDQAFWNDVLRPLYFEAKVNFDGAGKVIDNNQFIVNSFDSKLAQLENRTPEEFKASFDYTVNQAILKNCQKVFLAQKLDERSEWRFETCPVAADQPPIDLSKVTSIPVTILNDMNRPVVWQKTPNLSLFKQVHQTVFVKN